MPDVIGPDTPPRLIALAAYAAEIQPNDYALEADICMIGRSAMNCQIVVSQMLVSRTHARVERKGSYYILQDENSANGTFVNGQRLTAVHQLQEGDLIGLGVPAGLLRFFDPASTFRSTEQLHYDEQRLRFRLGKQELDLTPQEMRLLHHLYRHSNQLCGRESCAQALWGHDYDPGMDADPLDRIVANLRKKFRQVALSQKDPINTRPGLGYELIL